MKLNIRPQMEFERQNLGEISPLFSPIVIYIESSSYCNLKCVFCPQHLDPQNLNKQNMSLETFKKVINDINSFPKPLAKLRMCGTGDPTFNKKLPEMLDYARQNANFDKFELISNGLLINENLAQALTRNLDRLIISIEGLDEEKYKEFTNTKIDYQKFINRLQFVYENKKNCKIHIKIHNNAVKLPEEKKKFYSTFSNLCDEIYIENLVDLWPETDSSYVTSDQHRFIEKKPEQITVCSQIFKTMQINSDGSVIPCSIDWKAVNKIGDANKENLLDIWNGDKMREIRIKHLKGKRFEFSPCSSCSFNEMSDNDYIDTYAKKILSRIEKI
ncbi:radical SAM protein [Candidatus Pelagibacter sp.]|nr:radical SAM protein [Candidatus Pelagibacter sp.]